ncbi:SIR2 family NAD-dependent protein deacylase [Tepidiphilus baoligensis]|uniref:protein acetyllysine N-acetyltransferase n=1 Tax=Tepidiphilus baoligensis TaxID=2698687 RepID=A0ABX1QPZ8_9PROT|nr:NAD-dependent protein deacylase [Tepidiphilus baoligensis]NMH17161.1 NAD-dependent protein deacylase [Tepidiphilus baoligensis]
MTETHILEEIAELLAASRRPLFITGAGISAASGLPTYRGTGGLYADGVNEEGLPYEEVLSGHMLQARPELTWRELARMACRLAHARANAAHRAIAEVPHAVVLTQNVDGLHLEAGSRKVIEIHGNLRELHCTTCTHTRPAGDWERLPIPPLCPQCGAVLRPGVVLFGEPLPRLAVEWLEEELARGFDLVFSIGTTSLFPYIAEPVALAASAGVPTVEINPERTAVSHLVDYRLRGDAAALLPRIVAGAGARGG